MMVNIPTGVGNLLQYDFLIFDHESTGNALDSKRNTTKTVVGSALIISEHGTAYEVSLCLLEDDVKFSLRHQRICIFVALNYSFFLCFFVNL
jgi:hypothetical protein